jgi:signal transduction histidine kinase/DNA-binding response OmpR family regulator
MAKNISERIKHKRQIFEQQQQLQASHLHNQSILDNANCSIITTDVNGKITTFSKGAQKMLGYSEDEMLGQIGPDVVVPILHLPSEVASRSKALSAELQMVIEPGLETFVAKTRLGLVDENEWTYIHNDGHHITVLLTVTAQRDAQDNIIGFMGIAIDISERKRVERLKSEFVSTVSHELRTPLTSIRGALGLVLGKASMDLSDKARMLLETANRNSERLTLLINDLLDLEKIESGTLVFSLSPVDIVAIARQAVVSHESYASQHQVSLVLHDAPTYVPVMGDEHRLLQVFSNLLSNAIKYSPAQGLVEVSIRQQDHYVRIGIKDSGGGIPEAFRTQIFQRFAQADSSDTRAKGGTGLGLSISKAIIERHDGTIGYHSQEGVGTEFYLEIPLWQEVILHDHTLDQRPHLLVCEDNTDVAHILSQLLAQEGLASDIAHSATAAKHLLAAHNYRALLLDLTLPDMDGLTLITELHNNSQLHDLPIIVVSGRIEANQSSPAVEYNHVIDWLQKPVVRERLTSALHKALAHGHKARILHIEDDHDIIQITQTLLEGIADYSYACTITDAKAMLAQRLFDIILLDLMLPDGSGLELLDMIKQQRGQVIIFSGHEPTVDTREQVNAVLIKSKTSNQQLLNTVKQIINREHDHLG